ncbi:hypothetical protein ZIOFF_039712 [Zingiber officinale]|uniref:SHSP domain-containing protein n=1 Tax=Zingiber officinale TaxID=94328 RepID=A0A8J5L409_ZINOF|nr:hypothetical protein ZIOFF_039712 [Zingiber officinale]
MSLAVAVGPFFDSSVNSLLHLPETMEKISLPPSARRHDDEEEERSLESVPAVDILETAEEYTFIVDVPGLSKADVQVALEEGSKSLVIRGGGKRRRDEEEGCRYLRLERRGPTKFCRRFRMPEDSNSAAISAKCENGQGVNPSGIAAGLRTLSRLDTRNWTRSCQIPTRSQQEYGTAAIVTGIRLRSRRNPVAIARRIPIAIVSEIWGDHGRMPDASRPNARLPGQQRGRWVGDGVRGQLRGCRSAAGREEARGWSRGELRLQERRKEKKVSLKSGIKKNDVELSP